MTVIQTDNAGTEVGSDLIVLQKNLSKKEMSQAALERMPSLIEKQQKQIAMLQHEIPTLQEITARKWSKAEELERLKQGCKELQQRIDEALKEAERPQSEVPEEENTVRAA